VRAPAAYGEKGKWEMAITVSEPSSYEAYSMLVDVFQARMEQIGSEAHASFSDEREKGKPNVRRFVATNDRGLVVGWMTLKTQDEDLKIEGICTDPVKENSRGAAKALVTKAVNCSFEAGKGGVVTLTNSSKGTGDQFYLYMGFKYIKEGDLTMRLVVNYTDWGVRGTGESVETNKGGRLPVVEHYRRE
jgi:hypothetical protein